MKKTTRTAKSPTSARRAKTKVKDLKPQTGIKAGFSFVKKVDKAS